MRCPIFIAMAKESWEDNPEPKMLTDFEEAFLEIAEHFSSNINDVKTWTENGLQPAFADDLNSGLNSTHYFIEHFYRQGSVEIFRQIADKIEEGTHEIVVHPVSYNKRKEYKTMADGIKRRAFKGRRDEMLTLTNQLNVRNELASRGIIKYQLP